MRIASSLLRSGGRVSGAMIIRVTTTRPIATPWRYAASTSARGSRRILAVVTAAHAKTKSPKNPFDHVSGRARIESIVDQHRALPLSDIYEKVVAAARAFGPQIDDQTLLLARVI